jgi:hypothetical protein
MEDLTSAVVVPGMFSTVNECPTVNLEPARFFEERHDNKEGTRLHLTMR